MKNLNTRRTRVKRTCPICYEYTIIQITERDGWETWECNANGCINEYQIYGRVN